MTSQGSPYARFRRALDSRNGTVAFATATELDLVSLPDALELVLLLVDDPKRSDALRFAGTRYCAEIRDVGFEEAHAVLACLAGLAGGRPKAAAAALAELVDRRGLRRASEVLLRWAAGLTGISEWLRTTPRAPRLPHGLLIRAWVCVNSPPPRINWGNQKRRCGMRRKKRGAVALAAAALVGVLVVSVNVLPSAAQDPPPPPIATEFLTGRAVFTDATHMKIKFKVDGKMQVVGVKDASTTVAVRFTLQPGAQFPWHTHPGPVVVNVTQGELVYVPAETCRERSYPAGTAFVDPGQGHVHTAFNPTDEPTVLVATLFDAPAEGPLLIPAEPADCS